MLDVYGRPPRTVGRTKRDESRTDADRAKGVIPGLPDSCSRLGLTAQLNGRRARRAGRGHWGKLVSK
jgi:hypothetical protein